MARQPAASAEAPALAGCYADTGYMLHHSSQAKSCVVTSSWHLAVLKGLGSFTIIVQKVAKAMAGTFTRKPRGKKKLRVPGIHLKSSG
jgi:hypothetical protein